MSIILNFKKRRLQKAHVEEALMASTDFPAARSANVAAPFADAPNAAAPPRQLTVGVIAVLAGLTALGVLSTNIMLPAFPAIATSLNIAPRELGIVLSSFFFVFAFGQIFVGPISDRFGRRNLVVGGLALFVVGSVICALAGSLQMMVAGRIIQALGVCAASVLSRAIARDLFNGDMLAKALSMTMIAMAAAPGFSPLIGGLVSTYTDWRLVFVLVSVFAVVLAFFYLRDMGETHPHDRRAPLSFGAVMKSYAGLCLDARFICPAMSTSLIIGGLYATFAAAPVIMMSEIGMTPIQYGLYNAATVFVVFGAGMAAPRLAARFGDLFIARIGACLAAIGGLMLVVTYREPSLLAYTVSLVIFIAGMGIANPLGMAIALRPFGEKAGTASALIGFLQMSTAAVATMATTLMTTPPATTLGALQATGGLSALALLGYLAWTRQRVAVNA